MCFVSCYVSPLHSQKCFKFFFTCVFWEADAERRLLDLLCKQILLVEEEDNGGVNEELVVADGVEQHQRLMHAILWWDKERKRKGWKRLQKNETERRTKRERWG